MGGDGQFVPVHDAIVLTVAIGSNDTWALYILGILGDLGLGLFILLLAVYSGETGYYFCVE